MGNCRSRGNLDRTLVGAAVSIIALLLGRFELPRWAQETIVILAALGALWAVLAWHDHKVYDRGIAAQKQSDAAATASLLKAADIQTKAWQNRATEAEASNAKAQSDLALYRAARPIVYRVCFDARGSGFGVPGASALDARAQSGTAAASLGKPMPAGNPVISEDRGPLLDAFAALFDTQDDTLREFQVRDGITPSK